MLRNSASWEGERIGLTDYDSVFPIKNEMVSYPAKYDSPAISYEEFKDVVVEAQEVALAKLEAQEKALAEELANQSLFEKSDLVLIATVAGKDVAGDVVVCSLEDIQAVKGGIISTQMYNVPLPKSVEVGKTYMILMKAKKNGGYEIADKEGAVLEKGTPKFLEYAQNAG